VVHAEPTIGGRFGRVEPRHRVGAYLRGLPAGLERKNGWTMAEHAGAVSPDGMERAAAHRRVGCRWGAR
jgi:hypothetical protein